MVPAIEFQALRDALGQNKRSDGRVETLVLLALHGPVGQAWLAGRTGLTATGIKEQVEHLAAQGFAEIVEPKGKKPSYRATPVGERIGLELEALRSGSLAGDLLGRVIVCATRAAGRSDGALRIAMLEGSRTVLTGYGSLQYIGICDDDPGLVEALQGRLDELKAEPRMLRATQIVSA